MWNSDTLNSIATKWSYVYFNELRTSLDERVSQTPVQLAAVFILAKGFHLGFLGHFELLTRFTKVDWQLVGNVIIETSELDVFPVGINEKLELHFPEGFWEKQLRNEMQFSNKKDYEKMRAPWFMAPI